MSRFCADPTKETSKPLPIWVNFGPADLNEEEVLKQAKLSIFSNVFF